MGLVLTRKVGEAIILRDSNEPDAILATITFSELDMNQIRLNIEAPKHIDILRDDVYGRTEAAKILSTTRRYKENENQS